MELYIANVTKLDQIFSHYVDDKPGGADGKGGKLIETHIAAGHQILLEGEKSVLEGIIKRYRRYGIIEVKEAVRTRNFSGLMFQWEKEINMDLLNEAVERRHEVEDERSQQIRMIGILGDQQNADRIAKRVGIQDISVTAEIEEKPTAESRARGIKPMRQKLSVDEVNGQRRPNA
jgi:hypothetical protein